MEGKEREWNGMGGKGEKERKRGRGRDGPPGAGPPQIFWARTATVKRKGFPLGENWENFLKNFFI
jgi:hypothetical protein